MGPTSFPKTSRLKLATDFRDLIKTGKSVRGNGLVIYFRKSSLGESRLGIVISKRVLKLAVDRNKFKRAVREWYRKEKNNFSASIDLVVRGGENYKPLVNKDLQNCLDQLFKKAKLI